MAVRSLVTTGIALASVGVLIASAPSIAPPLTARDVQITADGQTALSSANAASVDPAASLVTDPAALLEWLQLAANVQADSGEDDAEANAIATVLSAALAAFADGGPVGAFLVALDALVEDSVVSAALAAFVDGGPVGSLLAALDELVEDPVVSAALGAFGDGGPVGSLLAALDESIEDPVVSAALGAFGDGGPVGSLLAALDELVEDPVTSAALGAFVDGGPVGSFLAALDESIEDPVVSAALAAFVDGGPVGALLAAVSEALNPSEPESESEGATLAVATETLGADIRTFTAAGLPRANAMTADEPQELGASKAATEQTSNESGEGITKADDEITKAADKTDGKSDDETAKAAKADETAKAATAEEENRLVRNGLQFTPETILTAGAMAGGGVGGAFDPFPAIKDVLDRIAGGGAAPTAPAATAQADSADSPSNGAAAQTKTNSPATR